MKELLDCKTCPMKRPEAWFLRYLIDPLDPCELYRKVMQNGGRKHEH